MQTFPDDFEFEGSVGSIYRQIGKALPVNLGYHLGRCLITMLNGKEPENMGEGQDLSDAIEEKEVSDSQMDLALF